MSTFSPPSHPPPASTPPPPVAGPSNTANGSGVRYAPTSVPTPGQPLLRNGKMLVYPHGWQPCPKCRNTGYKQGDPSHPCRKCWQDYGQPVNPMLISSAGLQGAKVLQSPLPMWNQPGYGHAPGQMPGSFGPFPSTHATGHAGFPGSLSSVPLQHSGNHSMPFSPQPTGSSAFAPPAQPPPPSLPPRRNPVNRTQESREDDLNDDGEAPPAYADAVAAGPDGALPPQRAEERREEQAQQQQQPPQQYAPPPHQPPFQHQPYSSQPYGSQQYQTPAMMAPGPQMMSYGHRAPPNALVVRPGDPRIGGRLCYKCGGDGIREDFWFGMHETCRLCNGSGRIF